VCIGRKSEVCEEALIMHSLLTRINVSVVEKIGGPMTAYHHHLRRFAACATVLFFLSCLLPYAHSQTLDEKWAALAAVQAKFDSLPRIDTDQDNQDLLNFILSRPEFSTAGIRGGCIWAKFNDGEEIVVINNLPFPSSPPSSPLPSTSSSSSSSPLLSQTPAPRSSNPTAAPTELAVDYAPADAAQGFQLPASLKVRLIRPLGAGFTDATADLRTWLVGEQNYTEPLLSDATVSSLRTVGGDGVLYFNTHGGPASDTFILWTATKADPLLEKNDDQIADDLHPADGSPARLIRVPAVLSVTWDLFQLKWVENSEIHYAITPAFIAKYWQNFGAHSFVYLDACLGGSDAAKPLRDAMFAKNVSVIAAWTNTTHYAGISAKLVFDRLLGANHVYPEADGYKQRAFTWSDISLIDFTLPDPRPELQKHGVGVDPATGAALVFITPDTPPPSQFGLLAPSIYFVAVDELNDELHILGTFGSDARPNASVTIGGVRHDTIKDWKKQGQLDELVIDLPRFGQGSAGDVLVTIRQHKSNVAQLTDWNGQFLQTFNGPQSISQPVTYNIHLRLDIRKRRDQVHEPPKEPQTMYFTAAFDSSTSYSCTGSSRWDVDPVTYYIDSWTGSGNLVLYRDPSPPPNYFIASGNVQNSQLVNFTLYDNPGFLACDANEHFHTVFEDGTVIDFDVPGKALLFPTLAFVPLPPGNYLPLSLSDATIQGDLREMDISNGFVPPNSTTHVKIQWGNIGPQYPPDPNAAR
jgi:hypothetical protein